MISHLATSSQISVTFEGQPHQLFSVVMVRSNCHEEPQNVVGFLSPDKHPVETETSNLPIRSVSS